jgi:hypothetical protein
MRLETTYAGVPITLLPEYDVQMAILDGTISMELACAIEHYYLQENRKAEKGMVNTEEYTKDPTDKVAAGAVKYDGGKAPMFQGALAYFPNALSAVSTVSQFGASKYAWKGWRGVDDGFNRYSDALVRHLGYEASEDYDPDSGLLHAAHAAWNALARLELLLEEIEVTR